MWLASRYRKHFPDYDLAVEESKKCSNYITAALKAGFKPNMKASSSLASHNESNEGDGRRLIAMKRMLEDRNRNREAARRRATVVRSRK
jgi:hypothetical protein